MVHVLLVEDDPSVADIISFYLSKEPEYRLHWASRVSDALRLMEEQSIDLVLLDIMLPDGDGMDLCYQLRQLTFCPIIFVSALDSEATIVRALQLGGDDYLVKPFSSEILLAKIRTHLRRIHYDQSGPVSQTPTAAPGPLTAGDLILDPARHSLSKNGVPVKISPTELEIMLYLMSHRGRVISQEELYQAIWKRPSYGDLRTISVHISNLRRKLEEDVNSPAYIKTIHSAGYLFDLE